MRRPAFFFSICDCLRLGITFPVGSSEMRARQPASRLAMQRPAQDSGSVAAVCESSTLGSPYIPVDSWVYPAVMRLYAMGYASDVYLGLRPWSRASVSHMLEDASAEIEDADMYGDSTVGEAQDLYGALRRELHLDTQGPCRASKPAAVVESAYLVERAIGGSPLRDSFHLGSTIVNDFGRPFQWF